MNIRNLLAMAVSVNLAFSVIAIAATSLQIDIKNEINLKDGAFLAKEYNAQGRYALITHNHGRFEGSDISGAICTDGFLVSKLPVKFKAAKQALKPNDYVFTNCDEAD